MKSAVTVCLVNEARQGPFVVHGASAAEALRVGCRRAAEIGFDAVEIFPTSHSRQPVAVTRGWYCPALHSSHEAALAAENLPARHTSQLEASSSAW